MDLSLLEEVLYFYIFIYVPSHLQVDPSLSAGHTRLDVSSGITSRSQIYGNIKVEVLRKRNRVEIGSGASFGVTNQNFKDSAKMHISISLALSIVITNVL